MDGKAGRLDLIGSRLEPDPDHDGSPARRGLTDLFAVGGFDALTRLRRLGEDVLDDRLARRLHEIGELAGPKAPFRQAREDRFADIDANDAIGSVTKSGLREP